MAAIGRPLEAFGRRMPASRSAHSLGFFHEVERGRVHAIAQPGGTGAVLEDMAKMGAAAAAHHFGPAHAVGVVRRRRNVALIEGSVEAGPAAARVILAIGFEQLIAATYAEVQALVMQVPVLAGEGALRAFFASDFELLGGQELAPLLVGLFDLFS